MARIDSSRAPDHGIAGRRSTPRVPLGAACELAWRAGVVTGTLLDLSVGGCSIRILQALPLGESAAVAVTFVADGRTFALDALVLEQVEETFGSEVVRLKFIAAPGDPDLTSLVRECLEEFRRAQAAVFRRHL